jgi:hypothetical protein
MTAIVILLVLIMLCMFKTVRIFIGIMFLLVWWNWPTHVTEQPPAAAIEQSVQQPAASEEPRPEPAPSLPRKSRPYIQQ